MSVGYSGKPVVMFARLFTSRIGEKQLREQECDKTPDCKLQIPIGEFIGVKRDTCTLHCLAATIQTTLVSDLISSAPHRLVQN